MKNKSIALIAMITILTIITTYWFTESNNSQKTPVDTKILVAVLMIKNEEKVMALTLQPLVDAGITQYLIYDTGSTDNTIAKTKEFFEQNNIKNYVIEQGPWIDFAASRNKALELTEYHFPCATFMLMLDAEWILHNGADLLSYCQAEKNQKNSVYLIHMQGTNIHMGQLRLMRTKSGVQFVGKVHEQPNFPAQASVPNHIYFELSPSKEGNQKTQERFKKDRDVLLKEVERHPNDMRTTRFLAQTYLALQDYENAIKWYKKLTTMPIASNEDLFSAYHYLGIAYQSAGNVDDAILTDLKAFSIRPTRAEPLVRLALLYYSQQDYALAHLFAKHACTIPYPKYDVGVVEKIMYDFIRFEVLSLTAHHFGDYQLGYQATIEALKVHPELEHLQKLLQFYESKLRN